MAYTGVVCDCCGWSGFNLDGHKALSVICSGALGVSVMEVQQRLTKEALTDDNDAAARDAGEQERCKRYEGDVRASMLDSLAERRFGKLEPATSIAAQKELVDTAMRSVKPELFRRVQPLLAADVSGDRLRDVIGVVCDVFGQMKPRSAPASECSIYSEKMEMRAHEHSFAEAAVHAKWGWWG